MTRFLNERQGASEREGKRETERRSIQSNDLFSTCVVRRFACLERPSLHIVVLQHDLSVAPV